MAPILGWIIVSIVALYAAICFGMIAKKHGRNPFLFGILSIITPVNLIILGYWAFSTPKKKEPTQ